MNVSVRDKLPQRRRHVLQKIRIGGQVVHYSIGLYQDGRPGELFVDVAKAGAALRTWVGDAAKLMSIGLQHGTPLATLVNLFIGERCDPCGLVENHPFIHNGLSIMDVIARDLAITFLGRKDLADTPIEGINLLVQSCRDCGGACNHGTRAVMDIVGGERAKEDVPARYEAHDNSKKVEQNTNSYNEPSVSDEAKGRGSYSSATS